MDTPIHPSAAAIAISIDRPAMSHAQTVTVVFGTHPEDAHTFAPLCSLRQAALPLF